ncbi:hypothetical protein DID78_02240 [Candidatus Marinamargulisbacteria bacterium SCGC AG-343-D04]|nr:hypothetical protein DID78_02240 [Candidatus Marinamargulisbacteria bacterium SCGC AG-343-D04]
MKKYISVLMLCLMVSVFSGTSQGEVFDKSRKGFVLGLGAGGHSTTYKQSFEMLSAEVDTSGLSSSVKIGYGFNEQCAVYYLRDAVWYSMDTMFGEITYVSGIMGVGVTYYFKPTTQTFFVSAGAGIGDLSAPFEDWLTPSTGSAITLGAGYEFAKHVSVEGKVLSTFIEESGVDNETLSFLVSMNYMWY